MQTGAAAARQVPTKQLACKSLVQRLRTRHQPHSRAKCIAATPTQAHAQVPRHLQPHAMQPAAETTFRLLCAQRRWRVLVAVLERHACQWRRPWQWPEALVHRQLVHMATLSLFARRSQLPVVATVCSSLTCTQGPACCAQHFLGQEEVLPEVDGQLLVILCSIMGTPSRCLLAELHSLHSALHMHATEAMCQPEVPSAAGLILPVQTGCTAEALPSRPAASIAAMMRNFGISDEAHHSGGGVEGNACEESSVPVPDSSPSTAQAMNAEYIAGRRAVGNGPSAADAGNVPLHPHGSGVQVALGSDSKLDMAAYERIKFASRTTTTSSWAG